MEYKSINWNRENYLQFIEKLKSLKDEKYLEFHKKLVTTNNKIIGIRSPIVKDIAKNIAKGDWRKFIAQDIKGYYEEIFIRGLIIGYIKDDKNIVKDEIERFLPLIDNWGICDGFVANLKIIKKNREYFFNYLKKLIETEEEYKVRFVLVTFLSYYMEKEYIEEIIQLCSQVKNKSYYVKMAQAWLISILFVKFPERTVEFLKDNSLDLWVHNKGIQKIRESIRVTKEDKELVKTLKK